MKIINQDEDGIGEILVKGENITKGYFEDEQKTKEAITEGWLHTGDLGKVDDNGFIYIYGRNNDMIVLSNGKKVFPEEIEEKINRIEGIKESIIFEENGKIYAKIVYSLEYFEENTEEQIYNDIMEKIKTINESLPQFKKINDVIITSEELEKTEIGKIKRNIEYEKIKENHNSKVNFEDTSLERIKNILIKHLGNDKINEETKIVEDLGADSLDLVEIFLDVEKEFDIKIEKEQRRDVVEVKDLVNIVNLTVNYNNNIATHSDN